MNKVIQRQHSTELMPGMEGGNKTWSEGVTKRNITGRAFRHTKENKYFNTGEIGFRKK